MKLKRLDLFLPRLSLVASRDVLRITEEPVLDGQSDRKQQNAAGVKSPTTVVFKDLLYRNGEDRKEREQTNIPDTGDPGRFVAADQAAVINRVMRDSRDDDDQGQNKEMR